jgi:drug/metabolite transporter (DMT)-like permease
MSNKAVSEKGLVSAIVISMFLWGLSWPSGKVLTHYTSVINFSVYRYLTVVATLFVLLSVGKVPMKIKRAGMPFVIVSGLLLAAYSYFFFMGLKNGAPGAGGVLVTTLNPIFAYAIGIVIDRRLPSRFESLGLALGLVAGSVLLKMWSHTSAIYDGGNLYFLIASATWAVMSKFTSRGSAYGSSLSFSLWQYVVTLLCLLPLTNVPEARLAIHINDPIFWLNLVFSSAIVTAIATTVYFYATTRLGAEKASSFIFLVPLAAALSSWLLLGEHIMPHTIVGGVLGIAAVYTINKKKKNSEA